MSPKEFTVQSLIHNQSFRRMVKGTAGADETERWNAWIEESEQNRAKAKEAIAEIAGFTFDDPEIPDVDKEWSRLKKETLQSKDKSQSEVRRTSGSSEALMWIFRVAAILLLGATIGVGFYIYSPTHSSSTHLQKITQEKTVRTDSNEQKTITFSNNSKIVLNSNSTITYTLGGNASRTIRVVLEGEAFFEAENTTDRKQPVFAVSTPDGVIKDIGTKFLVTVEHDRSRVVLQEGRVEVETDNQSNDNQKISVADGQMIEFTDSEVLKKKKVNTTFYTSWATGFMQFDQTKIQEFAGFVEERFNVRVQVVDSALANIKIDGGIYFRSLEELVRSVSEVADIPVYQSRDRETVFIGNKHNTNAH